MGADLFDDFQYVGAIKNRSPLLPQHSDERLQDQRRGHVEPGQGLVEDEYRWVMHEGGDEENALSHTFGIRCHDSMAMRLHGEKLEQGIYFLIQAWSLDSTQDA